MSRDVEVCDKRRYRRSFVNGLTGLDAGDKRYLFNLVRVRNRWHEERGKRLKLEYAGGVGHDWSDAALRCAERAEQDMERFYSNRGI